MCGTNIVIISESSKLFEKKMIELELISTYHVLFVTNLKFG